MAKIDIISGFLGAGKTTLIQKLIKEALSGEKVMLIENEFGEIGIDGGFLKEAGIQITEMNSGCICCSLVGDFETALTEAMETYCPDRIIIEPSGVGKLSDVMTAVSKVGEKTGAVLNSATVVIDATKAKMYHKNFGEFYNDQITHAKTIIFSRTDKMKTEKIEEVAALLRGLNSNAVMITTPWPELSGSRILSAMEKEDDLLAALLEEAKHHHEEEEREHHHHHHDHEHEHEHEHDHDHEHHHEHEHEHEHHEHEHEHEHHEHEHEHEHHDHEHDHEHEHEHDHDHDHHEHEHEHHDHDHEHEHEHHHDHDHHHHHHHADDVFTSWGKETVRSFTKEEIEEKLQALGQEEVYGTILRAKGMVAQKDAEAWIYFDYTPGEIDIREGKPDITGKLCVIGAKISEEAITDLFFA